jgi:hypothetical protein
MASAAAARWWGLINAYAEKLIEVAILPIPPF